MGVQARYAVPLASLSDHDRRILTLIAEGRTSNEIGDALAVSETTIKTLRSDYRHQAARH